MDKRLLVKIIIAISVSALLIGGIVAGIVLSRSRSPKKCVDGKSWSTTGKEPCTSCSTSCPTNKIVDKKCTTTSDTTCKCEQGWEGIGCTKCISNSKACGPNGSCQENGSCICNEGWKGVKCDQCTVSLCINGECNPKPATGSPYCTCKPGWSGLKCDTCTSNDGCINGTCDSGKCTCKTGWKKSSSGACDTCTSDDGCINGACDTKSGKCKCKTGWKNSSSGACDTCTSDDVCINSTCDKNSGKCTCNTGWKKSSSGVCDTCESEGSSNNAACNYVGICQDGKCKCPVDVNGDSLGWSGPECKVQNDKVSFPCIYGGTLEDGDTSEYCRNIPCPYPCNTKGESPEQPYDQCHNGDHGGGGWHCKLDNTNKSLPCRQNQSEIWLQKGEGCWGKNYNILPTSIPGKRGGKCLPNEVDCESGLECVATPGGSMCGYKNPCGICKASQ